MGIDHREPVAQGHHDLGLDAGERRRQHHVLGDRHLGSPIAPVVPVDAKEVERVRLVWTDGVEPFGHRLWDLRGVRELSEGREHDASLTEPLHRPLVDAGIHHVAFKPQGPHGFTAWKIAERTQEIRLRNR